MTVETNKQLVRNAFEAMGRSDIRPLADLMTDDFAWIIEGQSRFSRSYEGKEVVKHDLLDVLATERLAALDDRIAELERSRAALERLRSTCASGRKGPCPILDAFDGT